MCRAHACCSMSMPGLWPQPLPCCVHASCCMLAFGHSLCHAVGMLHAACWLLATASARQTHASMLAYHVGLRPQSLHAVCGMHAPCWMPAIDHWRCMSDACKLHAGRWPQSLHAACMHHAGCWPLAPFAECMLPASCIHDPRPQDLWSLWACCMDAACMLHACCNCMHAVCCMHATCWLHQMAGKVENRMHGVPMQVLLPQQAYNKI